MNYLLKYYEIQKENIIVAQFMKWNLGNTQVKININGNMQPSKIESKYNRIDSAVELIIAYAVLCT